MFPFDPAPAFAQAAGAQAGPAASFLQSPLSMLVIIFAIFYFLIIRPQQKKQREHQEMLKNLAKGDKIITNGGLYGTVIGLSDSVLTLQVDDKVKVRVARHAVAGLVSE